MGLQQFSLNERMAAENSLLNGPQARQTLFGLLTS
jgi:hypothetical protein